MEPSHELADVHSVQGEFGQAAPLPGDLVEKVVKKLYDADRDWLMETWLAEGRRIGSYLRMGYKDLPNLAEAALGFQGLLPFRRLEFRSAEGADSRSQLVVRAIGAGMSPEATACAELFVRGVVDAYSWSVRGSRTAEGIIEMQLTKEKHQSS